MINQFLCNQGMIFPWLSTLKIKSGESLTVIQIVISQVKSVALMPRALLILLSKSLTYITTNNGSPLELSRTPYRILVLIASKQRNLTDPYYGCIYILNYNVITQSQRTTILYFIFIWTRGTDISLIWYRCCFPRPALLCWQYWPVILAVLFPTCI